MRRVAALAYLADGDSSYDRYGFSPETTKNAFPFFQALYKAYFRVRSEGHANIPESGPSTICPMATRPASLNASRSSTRRLGSVM